MIHNSLNKRFPLFFKPFQILQNSRAESSLQRFETLFYRFINPANKSRNIQYWPESSGLGNAADFCSATLPMALPPKNFLLKIA